MAKTDRVLRSRDLILKIISLGRKKRMPVLLPLILGGMILLCPGLALAQCTPLSATLCVGGDDKVSVWINGHPIASGIAGSKTSATCGIVVPIGDLLTNATNDIAVSIDNSSAGYAFGSWDLQIVCSEGTTTDVNSGSGNTQMYNYIPSAKYTALSPA